MKSRNNLEWESEVSSSAAGWASVNPSTGNGDTNITINVTNETGWADPDTLSGTVTFRCINCESVEEKEKTIDVCRCACSCCDLKVTPNDSTTAITESGLAADTIIGTYTFTSRCEATKITGTITKRGGTEQPLIIEGGNVKLTNAIPYNQEMSEVKYDVKIFFDRGNLPENGKCESVECGDGRNGCNTCKSWEITQNALECNCDNSVIGKVSYCDYFNGITEIPQSGLTANTEIFTYSLKQYCPDIKGDEKYLKAKISYLDENDRPYYNKDLTIIPSTTSPGTGRGVLSQSIGSNDETDKRKIVLKVSYGIGANEEECESRQAKQEGCTCYNVLPDDESFIIGKDGVPGIPTFNQEYADECEDGQDCIAVKVGDKIGTYTVKPGTTCPSDKITATLESNGVTYPLYCNGGNVYLTGDTNILENSSHDAIPFTAKVYYNGGDPCDVDEITQPGVACNCSDIDVEGRITQFRNIPREGSNTGYVLGNYSLISTQCDDESECLKIEEVDGLITVKLQRTSSTHKQGDIVTTSVIQENGDPVPIIYTFKVYYKVNNKWRECKTITAKQAGLECACSSITFSVTEDEGDWAEFPYAGTHGEWVRWAEGDTGLYACKKSSECSQYSTTLECVKHDECKVFAGVCGKLGAKIGNNYLIEDDEEDVPNRVSNIGDKIRIIGIPLTQEEEEIVRRNQGEAYLIPHRYVLYANIREVQGTTDILTVKPSLFFYKNNGDGTFTELNCGAGRCGFKITDGACDCNRKPELTLSSYANPVSCDGTSGIKELGYILSDVHKDMTITAELLDPENSLIKDFDYSFKPNPTYFEKPFSISGNVESPNDTGSERTVGTVRLTYICNKGTSNEWDCKYLDFPIKQEKCPECDCDYIKDYCPKPEYTWETPNVDIHFSRYSTSVYETLTKTFSLDCGKLYIEGQDEETGIYTGEWYTAQLSRENYGNGYFYVIVFNLKDGFEHDNRTDSLTIHAQWYNPETEQWENCTSFTVTIYDEICDCRALNVDKFEDMTVTIPVGTLPQNNTECWYELFNIDECIELYIVGDGDTPTGTSSNQQYEYKENGETIYTAYVYNTYYKGACVYVKLYKDLDPNQTYTFVVKARYKDDNDVWQYCNDISATVTVKQKTCDCSTFKNKVYFTTSFDQSNNRLNVASISSGCGRGKLFVTYNNTDYCVASDLISDAHEREDYSMDFIESINGCTIDNCEGAGCCDTSFYIDVTPLPEDTERTINVSVYWCNDDGTLYKDENNNNCYDDATITQSFTRSCDDVNCNSYSLGINWPSTYYYELAAGSSLTEVASFNKLPEKYENCYRISVADGYDDNVASLTYDEDSSQGSNMYAIKVALKPDAEVGAVISIDVNAYYNGGYYGSETRCEDAHIQILII